MRSRAALYVFVFLASPLMGQQGIFLAGKVAMEDGSVPPFRVGVMCLCPWGPFGGAVTDEKGAFSFALPIETHGNTYTPILSGCELRVQRTGYQAEPYNLSLVRAGDNVKVGTFILHPLTKPAAATVSATSLAVPADARKAFDRGVKALNLKNWQEARKQFQTAIDRYPRFADAWFGLGKACEGEGRPEEARTAYTKCNAIDPKLIGPYLQLANMAARNNDWKEVAEITAKVIELSPAEYPSAYFYNSLANNNLKNLDAAERSAREGMKVDRQHTVPKLEQMLGVVLANKQDYAGAAQALRGYLEHTPSADDAEIVKKQLAQVEALLGGK